MNLENVNDQCKPNNVHVFKELNRTLGKEAIGFSFD